MLDRGRPKSSGLASNGYQGVEATCGTYHNFWPGGHASLTNPLIMMPWLYH